MQQASLKDDIQLTLTLTSLFVHLFENVRGSQQTRGGPCLAARELLGVACLQVSHGHGFKFLRRSQVSHDLNCPTRTVVSK